MSFFKEMALRLKTESPVFFKRIRNICVALSATGAALMVTKTQMNIEWLPNKDDWKDLKSMCLINQVLLK